MWPGKRPQPPPLTRTNFDALVSVSHDVLFDADSPIDVTVAALRVELAEQDATDIREGRTATLHEYYSSSTLIVVGLEIEDQQYVAPTLSLF